MKRAIGCACFAVAVAGCGGDSGSSDGNAVIGPAAEAPPRMCPTLGDPRADHDKYRERARGSLVGKDLDEAEAWADASGCRLVAAVIDGEPQVLTREYDPTRIQAELRGGEVVRILGFG